MFVDVDAVLLEVAEHARLGRGEIASRGLVAKPASQLAEHRAKLACDGGGDRRAGMP